LKALAGKVAAALPGVIGAIVSWLLKTAGSVAVWLAEHLWALAFAVVAAVAVWLRDYRACCFATGFAGSERTCEVVLPVIDGLSLLLLLLLLQKNMIMVA